MLNVDDEASSLSLAVAYCRVEVVFHDDDDDDEDDDDRRDAYLLVATSHVRKSVVKASAVETNSTKTARSGVKLIIIMGRSAFLS